MSRQPPKAFTERPIAPASARVDPLKLCVTTTVAAIAWLITPGLAVTVFASLGVTAYWKAYRRGLLRSRCLIGDTRLVLIYLATLGLGGLVFTVSRFI